MKLGRLLRDFNELVMFKHTVFAMPFLLTSMVTAAGGWFGWQPFLLAVLAAVAARNYAMAVNRLLDRPFDAQNPRTANRPSVDGRVAPGVILLFIIVNAVVFVGASYAINTLAFQLSFVALVILGGYTLLKRVTPWVHLVLGLSLGLAPIAGAIVVLETVPFWSVWLALGVMVWVAGFDLLYSLQDMAFDREKGLYSVPAAYGAGATLWISAVLHLLAVLFWALFVIEAGLGVAAYGAVVLAALMLLAEHRIVHRDFTKIDRAFFTVNGYLGIAFFILIVGDVLWKS